MAGDIAKRDQNSVPTLLAVSSSDGVSTVTVYADPISHRLLVSASIASAELTATGTVNGSNTAFTFVSKPTYIVSDGAWYKENKGWTWNTGTLTATLTVPPSFDIWGF